MIPGTNLLAQALTVIQSQSFGYRKFIGRVTNDIGIDVPSYDPEVTLKGSIQPIERSLYQGMGLDWKKNYVTIYSSDSILGVGRDSSGDQITFAGKLFQVLSENDWRPIDGWAGVLCVEINQ